MVFGEQPPSPHGWLESHRVDQRRAPAGEPVRPAPPRATSASGQLSLSDMLDALATVLGPARPLPDTPGDRFHQLAELRSRAEGSSLADAYSRQSASTPELWDDVRNAQPREV